MRLGGSSIRTDPRKWNLPTPLIVVPGTFWKDVPSWRETYSPAQQPMRHLTRIFGCEPVLFDWSGANSAAERHRAAEALAELIEETAPLVHLLGFSHGGNVASEAAAQLKAAQVDLLVTIATPVTGNYKTGGARRHVHLYSPADRVQLLGGEGPLGIPVLARREFPGALNVAIPEIEASDMSGSHGNILWSEETWRILEGLR